MAPPKEFSYPKIRNPQLKGVACKHVLKAAVMLQSVAWQKIIGKQMELAANRVSFGDDRKYSHVLTKQEAKAAAKNRSTKIDPEKQKPRFVTISVARRPLIRNSNRTRKRSTAFASRPIGSVSSRTPSKSNSRPSTRCATCSRCRLPCFPMASRRLVAHATRRSNNLPRK